MKNQRVRRTHSPRPDPWVYLAGTISWVLLMARYGVCRNSPDRYLSMCYSDIEALWYHRGLADGLIPYLQHDLEYPVLTGALMELGRRLAGFVPGGGVDAFFGVTSLMLFGFFLLTLRVHLQLHRPWDAFMIAASPLVVAAALVNWDTLVMFFTSAALLAWARGRHYLSGVMLGLGTAAKLYPILIFVPLAILALRASKQREFFQAVVGATLSFLAVNLPIYLMAPQGWLNFWTFNADRGADLGSFWLVLSQLGVYSGGVSLPTTVLMVVGTAGIAALMLLAPQRPRLAQGVLLIVILFLVVNKVYSPQYCLWLLPLVVLALPSWKVWFVFTAGELVYFAAVWWYLAGSLSAGDGQPRLYWLAIVIRIVVQLGLAATVVWQMWHPDRDPTRIGGSDDPNGGVFDLASDAYWLSRLLRRPEASTPSEEAPERVLAHPASDVG